MDGERAACVREQWGEAVCGWVVIYDIEAGLHVRRAGARSRGQWRK